MARSVLLAAPLLTVAAYLLDWSLRAPEPIMAALALLAGTLIGSFGQLNTLRLKMTDRVGDDDPATAVDRDALDETAGHLLTASWLSGATVAELAIGLNVSHDGDVHGVFAALGMGMAAYVFLTFLLAVPRLYSAYVLVNAVDAQVSGFVRSRRS